MTGATLELRGDPACPKHMVHGPCGGVQADGSCEIGGACPFVASGTVLMPAPGDASTAPRPRSAGAIALLELMDRRPIVVADLPSPGPDPDGDRALAAALAGHVDAALLGDAPWARLQLPPGVRAGIVAAEGVRPWSGLNCRDRNRVALEAELAGIAAIGVPGVHCVTGDHPGLGSRTDAQPVFDLDSTELATLAARTGLIVSVAESPDAPPALERAARAAAKGRAGAEVCFINHAHSRDAVGDFVAEVHTLAPSMRLIACVPLVASAAGAERVAQFLHGPLPAELLAPLEARDPLRAAVALCVETAQALLAIPGLGGVDLSAPAGPGESAQVAAALALAAAELGGGS